MKPAIAILTDFGTTDPFVGIMKGVIKTISPETEMIDLTHAIPPGNIHQGAITLWQSVRYFPHGTVFLAVVDPGVGTKRRPMILQTQNYGFIGPDNGLFTYILDDQPQAWELANPNLALPTPKKTFHGRDIFAPAAAHAARGIPGLEFGPPIPHLVRLPNPKLDTHTPGKLFGEVLHTDQFGNILTSLGVFEHSIEQQIIFTPWRTQSDHRPVQLIQLSLPNGEILKAANTFAEIPENQCRFMIGSSGLIEIVANRQSAANLLNLRAGDEIALEYQSL